MKRVRRKYVATSAGMLRRWRRWSLGMYSSGLDLEVGVLLPLLDNHEYVLLSHPVLPSLPLPLHLQPL